MWLAGLRLGDTYPSAASQYLIVERIDRPEHQARARVRRLVENAEAIQVIQEQVDAYTARDFERFLVCYAVATR